MGDGHLFPAKLAFTLNNIILRRFRTADRVIEGLSIKSDDVIVDFGCGPGFYTIPFAKKAKRVIGIDVQAGMLEKAANYAEKSNVKVEFHRNDGRRLPLPDSVADLVFMRWAYHELDDKRAVLKELTRVLKPDGRLAIMEKTRRGFRPIGPPTVDVTLIADSIVEAEFDICDNMQLVNETIVVGRRAPS